MTFDDGRATEAQTIVAPPKHLFIDFTPKLFCEKYHQCFFRRRKMKCCKSSETFLAKVSRRSEFCSGGKMPFEVSKKNRNSRVSVRKGNFAIRTARMVQFLCYVTFSNADSRVSIFFRNFERSFTPRTWLRSARNFGKTRFRRFASFHFSTLKFFFGQKFCQGVDFFFQETGILEEL